MKFLKIYQIFVNEITKVLHDFCYIKIEKFKNRIVMTPEELKEFLKEHLKIELYTHYESYRSYLGVKIKIDEEEIDSSVNYDIEL